MVVVLAAALAYRYHCATEEETTEIERKLSEQWQRTESFRDYFSSTLGVSSYCGTTSSTPPKEEAEEEEYSIDAGMFSPSDEQESIVDDTMRETVRQEWVNAMFGTDFFSAPNYQAPRQGVGLAQIPSYTAYTATIPPCPEREKVGMTLSSIGIGVYVRKVVPESEAHVAGIQGGSILVSINSLPMLGEPTKQALERLWQYEGLFTSLSKEEQLVEMTFIKDGTLYSVLLLSGPPFGISWASCGQFPLVQRSYAFAAQAGVRRGSLVAAIHDKASMRNMDHQVAAKLIGQLVQQEEEIHLTLVFTPAASRTSYVDRTTSTTPNKRTAITTEDGVEVRVHPLAYSIGTLFQSKSPQHSTTPTPTGGVSELASQVASGMAVAPTGLEKNLAKLSMDKLYRPCPPLQSVVQSWNPWNALAYCLLFESSNAYQTTVVTPSHACQQLVLERTCGRHYESFLLACIHVVCECGSQLLMNQLLDQAETSEAFRQTLHYLLRAYIMTLERQTRVDGDVMEILQAAQFEVTDRIQDDSTVVTLPTSSVSSPQVNGDEATMSISTSDEKETGINGVDGLPSTKKKSVFRVFKRKGSKSSSPHGKSSKGKSPRAKPKSPEPSPSSTTSLVSVPSTMQVSISTMFDNMTRFLQELDSMCDTVERSLLKSISQKIADWALQPWSLSKQKALVAVTESMRQALMNSESLPVVNPIESSEVLASVDPRECYILPSAHFPLLLTFNVVDKQAVDTSTRMQHERLYRTRVEIVSLRGSRKSPVRVVRMDSKGNGTTSATTLMTSRMYFVQGAVCGVVRESGRSNRTETETSTHFWEKGSLLTFDTRSSWGAPQTLSLRLSSVDLNYDGSEKVAHADESGTLHYSCEVGYCWVDLRPMWARIDVSKSSFATVMCHAQICSTDSMRSFDQHGDLHADPARECFEVELKVTTEMLPFDDAASGFQSRKRMLLYKHDDDLRQELFAIEFIQTCNALLKASGLDLNLLTFRCIPVGARQGFIEWVPGSVPLSDICKAADDVALSRDVSGDFEADKIQQDQHTLSETARAGLTKYQSLYRMETGQVTAERGAVSNNPIQDFLRSVAYDPDAPYLIRKEVMDTYVKSCAGYCIVTYLLGVGDRHLDNLLLHQTGHFFHCDFSFILGEDPKKYLPMRLTEDMIFGMGGKESDNYAMFVSLVGAAFLALRRHENVRVLLALVRFMVGTKEVSIHGNPEQAIGLMRERLCLNLSDAEAVNYIEELMETSISSKLWMAVDAIHSLGKRF